MTLLYIDSFDTYGTSGQPTDRWTVANNTAGGVSSAYGRNGVGYRVAATQTFCTADRTIPNASSLVIGFAFRPSASLTHNAAFNMLALMEGSTVHFSLGYQSVSGLLEVYRGTQQVGTFLAIASNNALTLNVWHFIELKLTVADGGSFSVRCNGNAVGGLTGVSADTRNGGGGFINVVRLTNSDGNTQATVHDFDDLYVLDTTGAKNNDFLGDCRVEAMLPQAEGNYSEWVPSAGSDNAALVNEADTDGDASFVSTSTIGQRDSYLMSDLTTVTGVVYGVQTDVRARKDETGARAIAPLIRRAPMDSLGADNALSTAYASYIQMFEADPTIADDWTIANVNATEFGVKLTL